MTFGMDIIESEAMVDYVEDWSRVRSPSRAIRRRRRGFPQNIVTRAVPKPGGFRMGNKLVMHPVIAAQLRKRIADDAAADMDRRMMNGLMFGAYR